MFKKTLYILLVIFSTTSILAQENKTSLKDTCDFCGKWYLDKVSDELTTLPIDRNINWFELKARSLIIKTEENKYVISIVDINGSSMVDLKFFTDGKGETNESPFRIYDQEKKQYVSSNEMYVSKTKAENNEINSISKVDLDINGFQFSVKRVVSWKLSKDKKELIEKVSLEKDKIRGNMFSKDRWDIIKKISIVRKYSLAN